MKKIVVFTGAGISAESGIQTFRGSSGLWENYRIEDVATPQAWQSDQELVLEFYNQRRKQVLKASPNDAHLYLAKLQEKHDIQIITQNIDDLHERAGSNNVLHLHGEIRKSQSSINPNLVYEIDWAELNIGEKCELGSQLRPHVVWFGEEVPNLIKAIEICRKADVFIVIGTSLQVYPAANLIYETNTNCKSILIDPNAENIQVDIPVTTINKTAVEGIIELELFL